MPDRQPEHNISGRHSWLVYGLLAVLVWLPLPSGSKPEWAMVLMACLVILLAILWLGRMLLRGTPLSKVFFKAWPFHSGFALLCLWLWLQQYPLPSEWVAALSPEAWQHYTHAFESTGSLLPDRIPLSLDAYATRLSGWLTLSYWLLFCLVLSLIDSVNRVRQLAWTVVLAGTFQAAFGAFTVLAGLETLLLASKKSYLGVATGTFVNRNSFAGFLEITLAVGIGLLLTQIREQHFFRFRDRLRSILDTLLSSKVVIRSALAVMVIGMVMSRSRMGNTAFFSSLVLSGLLYVICRRKFSRGIAFLFISLLAVDMAIVSQWFGLDQVIDRLEQTSIDHETRPNVARLTLNIIKDYSLTGTGAGTFYTALPEYHDGSWRGFYDLAHNDLLQFPAEFGLPAYGILGIMVLLALWLGVQAMHRRRSRLYIGMGFSSVMGMTALLIHSTVDFNLQIPANGAYFVVLMALAVIARYQPSQIHVLNAEQESQLTGLKEKHV